MMTDDERRKVFWLLKKYSSYTAWKVLADAYYVFSDAWMKAMKTADDADIDEFNQRATKDILDGRIAFEKGLPRLKQGDRSVWRENSRGQLSSAAESIIYVHKIMNPDEYVFDWMKNKSAVIAAERALDERVGGLYSVCELAPNSAAYWRPYAVFDPFFGPYNFPTSLPEVPAPAAFAVETDTAVPVDGIYEPEWGDLKSGDNGILAKMKSAAGIGPKPALPPRLVGDGDDRDTFAPVRRREQIGCMNYLLADTQAPYYQDRQRDKPVPVTWRLIWKDTRYLDGTIPPEEEQYVAAGASAVDEKPRLRCPAGKSCPEEGYWLTPANADSRRFFKAGEAMPSLGGDYGETIWQWAPDQSPAK